MTVRQNRQNKPLYNTSRGPAMSALSLSVMMALSCLPAKNASAQEASQASAAQSTDAQSAQSDAKTLDAIVVTGATKRGPQNVQDVAAAVTALGPEQLEELNFQNLQSLSYSMPNVQMDDIGTMPGYANFSIRGLGINSSIPSIDPTVGVFIDGVYMGVSAGMIVDNFDLQGIEVLRGPQGVLFGRNVTGGAVLINTRPPTDDFNFDARVGVETGLRTVADATVRGPLVKGLLAGKLAVYGSHDEGWFTNKFNGKKFGGGDTRLLRAALKFTPADEFDTTLRFEHGTSDGDGPASQNPALASIDTHDVTANADQFLDSSWTQLFSETNWRVPFGNGTITNVFGWRKYEARSLLDVDSTDNSAFHARLNMEQDQLSNELRYAGSFGNVDITAGHFVFQQRQLYIEERTLDVTPPYDANPPNAFLVGGGDGDFESWGVFLAADWHISDAFTLNLGARYSNERKDADVARLRPGGGDADARTINPDFPGLSREWSDVSPKVGFQWKPGDNTHIYGFWAKGFRSGGYNFRHTALALPVESFDAEEQRTIELGLKQEFPSLGARLNVAVFQNELSNLQRESNDPSIAGVQQIIRNVGDATIRGIEAEGLITLGAGFTLTAHAGYTKDEYDSLLLDISGDGVVDDRDYALRLPRAAPWSYGVALLHDLSIGSGKLMSRISYNHRDEEFYSDNNVGVLNKSDRLDANFTWAANEHWSFSLYGTNLLDEVSWGGDTVLPPSPVFGAGGAGSMPTSPRFRPPARGRVVGAEVRYAV